MRILFSPIGTADPLTQLGDGPMLHIVRHCMPEKVVLFLSPKVQGFERLDAASDGPEDVRVFGRYEAAIRRLCIEEGRPIPSVERIKSDDAEVHRFDVFINEFELVLRRLCDESAGEPVLVNVTSGTPGWQSALVALGSFGRLPLKLLQVSTPKRDANERHDRENPTKFSLDDLWSWNEDLRKDDPSTHESRIVEVVTPNFTDRLVRENVIALANAYDYEAAYKLASFAGEIDEGVREMIRAAADRLNLDGNLPARVFARSEVAYRPNDPLGEYLSVMEVRYEQGHWADFLRLMTPALTRLVKNELQKSGLPERRYARYVSGKPTNVIDWDAVESDDSMRALFRRIGVYPSSNDKPTYITNYILFNLLDAYGTNEEAKETLLMLRQVERKCRNELAHNLKASNKNSIERLGGITFDKMLSHLFALHGNMRPHLYADINREIIKRL